MTGTKRRKKGVNERAQKDEAKEKIIRMGDEGMKMNGMEE